MARQVRTNNSFNSTPICIGKVLFLVRNGSFILVAGPSFTRRTPVIFGIVEEKSFPFLKSGRVVGRWSDFRTFLTDELQAAEDYHQSQPQESWWL